MTTTSDPFADLGAQLAADADRAQATRNGQPSTDPSRDAARLAVLTAVMRARTLTVDQLLDLPAPAWLIDGLLPDSATTVMFGKPGSGKSFLALDAAICVALGYPWQARPVGQGRVLYVAGEGASGLGVRVRAWMHANRVPSIPGLDVFPGRVNLLDPEQRAALREHVRQSDYGLLVLDTLARSMVGGDENSSRDVGLVVDGVDACREARPGLTALIVHHMDKAGSTYRGSSALEGAADAMLEVADHDGLMTITCDKEKDHAKADPIRVRREIVTLPDGSDSCVLRAPTAENLAEKFSLSRATILEEFLTHFSLTGATRAQLAAVSSSAPATVYRAVNDLLSEGALLNKGSEQRPFLVTPAQPA